MILGAEEPNYSTGDLNSDGYIWEEKEKYPKPGKKDEYYEHRMDMSTMKQFEERDYMEALSYIGVLPD